MTEREEIFISREALDPLVTIARSFTQAFYSSMPGNTEESLQMLDNSQFPTKRIFEHEKSNLRKYAASYEMAPS